MSKPSSLTKAEIPEDVWLRQDTGRSHKLRASFVTLVKIFSSFLIIFFFYGAIRYYSPGLLGSLQYVGSSHSISGGGDLKDELVKGSKYLLGVGKADITG